TVNQAQGGDIGTAIRALVPCDNAGGDRSVTGTGKTNVKKIAASSSEVKRRGYAADHLVVTNVQEVLKLCASAEVIDMLALNPAEIVDKGVVLAVPNTLTGLLGVDVDGHHRIDAAFRPRLDAGVAERRGDHWNPGARGDPSPPMAQPVKVELVDKIGR